MIHPDTQVGLVNEHIGLGVFATQLIPKGTITYALDKLEIIVSQKKYQRLPSTLAESVERFSYIDRTGRRVLSWDHAKHVNHSCEPNSLSTGWGFEIAIRDILPGEELTDDYGLFNLPEPMPVACPCTQCRGVVQAEDFPRFKKQWNRAIQQALPCFEQVEQPLLKLIPRRDRESLSRYLLTGKGYRSVSRLEHIPKETKAQRRVHFREKGSATSKQLLSEH